MDPEEAALFPGGLSSRSTLDEPLAFTELDGKAALASPEGEVTCASIAAFLARKGEARKLYSLYMDDPENKLGFEDEPTVSIISVDSDVFFTASFAQDLNPNVSNMVVIQMGKKNAAKLSTIKSMADLKAFNSSITKDYGSIQNFIAICCLAGNDYVDHLNLSSPRKVSDYFVEDRRNGCLYDFVYALRDFEGSVSWDMWIQAGILKWEKLDLVTYDPNLRESGFPYRLNYFMMIGIILFNKIGKRAPKAAKKGLRSRCSCDREVHSRCPDGDEFPSIHKMFIICATIETYINYLCQQLDTRYKPNFPVTNIKGRVTGYCLDKFGKVRCRTRRPDDTKNKLEFKTLFGEIDYDEE